jgi:hypothetical protein
VLDVTAVALGNHDVHTAVANAAYAADGSGRLRRFHDLVATSPGSTNAWAGKVSAYISLDNMAEHLTELGRADDAHAPAAEARAIRKGLLDGGEPSSRN